MSYLLLCLAVFLISYVLNIFYITVLYHRGLAHGSVKLSGWARALVVHTGTWVTGIDPKAWACMHRLHHFHSDSESDPHSPLHQGVWGVMRGQLKSYEKVIVGLQRNKIEYTSVVKDLDFQVNWANRKKVWWLPYLLHAAIAVAAGVFFHAWLLGAAYWVGIMSHPLHGWVVNAFAHQYGYRNFNTADHSRNNTLVAWFVMGEGYQNNHHAYPLSAKFSKRWFEFDGGYLLCQMAQLAGFLKIEALPAERRV